MPGIVPASAREGRVRPFPWGTLASVTRDSARLGVDFTRFASSKLGGDRLTRALGELVRGEARVSLRSAGSATEIEPLAGSLAVLVEEVDAPWRAVIEAERALVIALVTRALGRPAPRLASPDAPLPPAVAGAFAAVVTAALRRAGGSSLYRVLSAGDGAHVWDAARRYHDDLAFADVHAWVDDDAYLARVGLARSVLGAAAAAAFDVADLARLGEAKLAMPVVLAASLGTEAELLALRVGDAWMPGARSVTPGGALGVTGRVMLAAPGCTRGLAADLGADGKVVVRGDGEDLGMGNDVAVENAGELPVVVRVEIGSVELRAREWAALKSGDVVALGQRVGAPVSLRVGSAEVARGELVEIDGEVGVRIVARGDGR